MSRVCHNCSFGDEILLILALKIGGHVSWHYRFLGDTITKVRDSGLVSMSVVSPTGFLWKCRFHPMTSTFPLEFGGWSGLHGNEPLETVKRGTFLLTAHEKKLLKSVPTWSKLWHPIDSQWGHDREIGGSTLHVSATTCSSFPLV